MNKSITINGTGFNVEAGAMSFEDFKKDGKESFAKGVSETMLKKIHGQLVTAYETASADEVASADTAKDATEALTSGKEVIITEDDGNTGRTKEAGTAAAGKGK